MTEELIYKYKIISLDYIKNRNITLAIKTLVEGLEINNKDVDLLNILGLCFYKKCMFNEAKIVFERSLSITARNKAKRYLDYINSDNFKLLLVDYNEGIKALKNRELNKAKILFENIIKRENELIEPYCILTEICIYENKYEEAKAWLEILMEKDIGNEKILTYIKYKK